MPSTGQGEIAPRKKCLLLASPHAEHSRLHAECPASVRTLKLPFHVCYLCYLWSEDCLFGAQTWKTPDRGAAVYMPAGRVLCSCMSLRQLNAFFLMLWGVDILGQFAFQ